VSQKLAANAFAKLINDYHLMQELIEEVSELEGNGFRKRNDNRLRRLIAYAEKIFQLPKTLSHWFPTEESNRAFPPRGLKSSLVLFGPGWAAATLGNRSAGPFWQRWLGDRPSARTLWDASMLCSMPRGCGKGFTMFTSV